MIIRLFTTADIDPLIEMGERMHMEGAYSFLSYDREKVRRLIISYLNDPENRCGLVAEDKGVLLGMFGGFVSRYFFCDEKLAVDQVLFVDRQFRGTSAAIRLVRSFLEWASTRGVREVSLAVSTNIDNQRTGRFYKKMGFIQAGEVYKMRQN